MVMMGGGGPLAKVLAVSGPRGSHRGEGDPDCHGGFRFYLGTEKGRPEGSMGCLCVVPKKSLMHSPQSDPFGLTRVVGL